VQNYRLCIVCVLVLQNQTDIINRLAQSPVTHVPLLVAVKQNLLELLCSMPISTEVITTLRIYV